MIAGLTSTITVSDSADLRQVIAMLINLQGAAPEMLQMLGMEILQVASVPDSGTVSLAKHLKRLIRE